MKIVFLILNVFFVQFAHADYNSDVVGKSVLCKGLNVTVIINKSRTEFSVIDAYNSANPEVFQVSKDGKNSDGDTFVAYSGTDIGIESEFATLTFSDQGDTLTYREDAANPISLHCR